MKKIVIIMLLIFTTGNLLAQQNEFTPSKSQFMIRGYGHTGFDSFKTNGETESTFNGGTFSPIFLFKHSDRLMFETELEFNIQGGEVEVGFEYADVMYVMNKYMTVRAGKFLLPFGTFMERLHPSWINRLTSKPLGFGHDGIAPSSGVGVELRGAFDIQGSKWNYAIYATNGPTLKDGDHEPEEAGMLGFENLIDNNASKAFGGRVGFLPFSDSSVEIGWSAYSTSGVGETGSPYENVGAFLYAWDFSFVKQISSLGGIVDIKAQYNNSKVDDATYFEEHEGELEEYTFDNKSNSFYTQLSYRPSISGSDFLKNLEFVGRYSEFNAPEGAEWEEKTTQYTFGINYWLSWRSVIKLNYQTRDSKGGHGGHDGEEGLTERNGISLHWAIGF